MKFLSKELRLLLALLADTPDEQLAAELKIKPHRLAARKAKLAKQLGEALEKRAKCAELPPCQWSMVPKPPVLSFASTKIKVDACSQCGAPLTRIEPKRELQAGEHFGEANELAEHQVCSIECFAKLVNPLGERQAGGKGRRVNQRGEWQSEKE